MMRMGLERAGNDFLKPAFDLKRRLAGGQGNTVGNAENMRVDGDRRRAESNVHDDIRGLAAYSGERFERLAAVRHLATEILDEPPRQGDHVFCLGAVEANRFDYVLELFFAERRHFGWASSHREKRGRGLVDAEVGRLRRKHDRDEQGEGVHIIEFAFGVRIGGFEAAENLGHPCRVRRHLPYALRYRGARGDFFGRRIQLRPGRGSGAVQNFGRRIFACRVSFAHPCVIKSTPTESKARAQPLVKRIQCRARFWASDPKNFSSSRRRCRVFAFGPLEPDHSARMRAGGKTTSTKVPSCSLLLMVRGAWLAFAKALVSGRLSTR